MLYFIVFFVFNICVCVQSRGKVRYNATFDFTGTEEGGTCANKQILVVKKNGPFNITITYSKNINGFKGCCNNANFNPCDESDEKPECDMLGTDIVPVFRSGMTNIKVLDTTKNIDTRWICTFMKFDEHEIRLTFEIKVKNIEDKPTVYIGGEETEPTIAPVEEYDYIYNYWYNDKELVDLDCYSKSEGKISFRYLNSNGTKLIETQQIETEKSKLTFRKILTTVNNGDLIDCEYNGLTNIVQRTIFKFKNDAADRVLKILINNQTLHPIHKDGEKNRYYYKYLEGDVLNVTCIMNKSIGRLYFGKENNKKLKSCIREETTINNLWQKTIKLHTKSINNKQLTCKNSVNDEAVIEFRLDKRELSIKGLNAKNVIDEYKKHERKWIIDYRYTIGETLDLECVARKNKKVQWIYKKVIIKKKLYKHTFVMEDEHKGQILSCQTKGSNDEIQRVNIKFHETTKISESTTEPPKDSAEPYDIIIPVACLLVVIVIGVMAACFCCWSKKIKLLRAKQNPYANLQEPDLPIPPYPVQWNNRLQKQTNSEENMTDNVLYNSNAQIYTNPQTKKQNMKNHGKNINKNKPISKIRSKLNDESQIVVDNSVYNINNAPKYCNVHKIEPIQSINNEEVAEYNYIEPSAIFNLKEDLMKNIPNYTSPTRSNMRTTNDEVIYVEPYARKVHLKTEPNVRDQAHSSNAKEEDYDYVYAGRYGNEMACNVNFNR